MIKQITPKLITEMHEDWIGDRFHILSPLYYLYFGIIHRIPSKTFSARPVYVFFKNQAYLAYQFNYRGQSKQFDRIRERNYQDKMECYLLNVNLLKPTETAKEMLNDDRKIVFYNNKEMSTRYNGILVPKDIEYKGEKLDLEQINSFLNYYNDGDAVHDSRSTKSR